MIIQTSDEQFCWKIQQVCSKQQSGQWSFQVNILCLVERNHTSAVEYHPNTKRFKRTLIYFDTNTQYANFGGNPLCQATKRHLAKDEQLKMMKNER